MGNLEFSNSMKSGVDFMFKNAFRHFVVAAFSLSVLALAGCATQTEDLPEEDLRDAPKQKKVVLYGYEFNPEKLEVTKGQQVTFQNKDPDTHNLRIPALNIDRDLKPGQRFTYTFNVAGDFAVSNETIDKPMRMNVIVKP